MAQNQPPIRYSYLPIEQVLVGHPLTEAAAALADSAHRVMVLTGRSVAANTTAVQAIDAALGGRCVGVFDAVRSHTPREDVWRAVEMAWDRQVDALIAIGGGSVIDAAKVLQLALNTGVANVEELQDFAQFVDGKGGVRVGAYSRYKQRSVRFIAVPTTLSGAEFSTTAGVLDSVTQRKEGYRGEDLCPRVIIYDPALCQHTPDWLWLSTAVRAVDHAVEGYCARDVHPFLEGQFLHGLSLFAESLRATKLDPADLHARALSQQATWLACAGLGRVSHGASHGIGYSLGALHGIPHGYTSCVMLPAVLAWNAPVNGDRQAQLAGALGRSGWTAAAAVRELIEDLALPSRLRDLGIRRDQLDEIAEHAAEHRVVRKNPRPITGTGDVKEILELAW